MKVRKNSDPAVSSRTIEVVPGLDRLKASLRPGQYLRARVLRYLDERRLLLRLLGRTVVASSTRRLRSNESVWVRVKSVNEKIHLQLAQPAMPGETAEEGRAARESSQEVPPAGFLDLPGRGQRQRIRVAAGKVGEQGGSQVWSIVLGLDDPPRASLQFVLRADTNSLSVQVNSESEELVSTVRNQREVVKMMAEALGFNTVQVSAHEIDPNLASGFPDTSIDLVI